MSDTPSTFAPKTPLQEFWFYFKQNRGALIGLIFILIVALISILAPYIAPFDPTEQNRTALLLPLLGMMVAILPIYSEQMILGEIFFLASFTEHEFPSLRDLLLYCYLVPLVPVLAWFLAIMAAC